jgi:hypothetical protein
MAISHPTPILASDQAGHEHWLFVAELGGLIHIADATMSRILAPAAAVALVTALIHALGGLVPPAGRA